MKRHHKSLLLAGTCLLAASGLIFTGCQTGQPGRTRQNSAAQQQDDQAQTLDSQTQTQDGQAQTLDSQTQTQDGQTQPAGQPQPPSADSTVHIGVMYSSDIIPLAIMSREKLDEKHGFRLDMQVFSSAKDRDAALQAGELDGVFTDYIGVCMYQNAGLDVKATGVTDGDYLLLAGADTGITDLAGAAGSDIAISENTLIEYSLDSILAENGLDASYLVKEVVPRIPDRLEMLRTGKIAMGLLPEPFATLAVNDGAVRLSSANDCGLYPAVSAFTQKALDSKKETLKRFYAAYDEAVDYINHTPLPEYEDTVIEAAGYPKELSGQIQLPDFRKNALPDKAALQEAIRWAAAKGLCEDSLTPDDLTVSLD